MQRKTYKQQFVVDNWKLMNVEFHNLGPKLYLVKVTINISGHVQNAMNLNLVAPL